MELGHAGNVEVVQKLLEALDVAKFREIGTAVNETVRIHSKIFVPRSHTVFPLQIDWEESTIAGRVCVRPGIDEELDNLKHVYNGIDSVLVRSETSTVSSCTYIMFVE